MVLGVELRRELTDTIHSRFATRIACPADFPVASWLSGATPAPHVSDANCPSASSSATALPLVEEAGAVVARKQEGEPQVLLVTAKKRPNEWIFPKGHIEPGESAEVAARREAEEEAGVRGHIVAPLGELRFEFNSEKFRVRYFLVQYENTTGKGDGRRVRWHSLVEAIRILTFPNARELLEKHWELIDRRITAPKGRSD